MVTGPVPEPDPFAAILRAIADARVDDAAAARARVQWLGRQAEEDATLAGALAELAGRGARLQVRVRGGASLQGVADGLGPDALVVRTAGGTVLVRTDRITEVRAPGAVVASAPGAARTGAAFADLLREVAAERAPVLVHTDDGREQRGELRAVGADVLTLRVGTGPPATVLVSLDAVTMVGLVPAT